MGGAIGNNIDDWKKAKNAVSGKIYNYYTKNDKILTYVYRPASFFLSEPIGLNPIKGINDIINIDTSNFVSGHTEYKQNANKFLK